ncbi:MAG: hypothetical protein PVJ73_14205 [Acidobacteriota bacterium]|jgi:hypothetical protein
MKNRNMLDRREFTLASAMAVLSGVAITVTGCGGGSYDGGNPASPSTPATPAPNGDKIGTVSANHGHSAVVTAARLAAPDAVELNITGSADHPHTVALSAEEIMQIAANTRVTKESSVGASHTHTVTFN